MSVDRYSLRWKGKTLGPFSRREIERKIQEHDLGMLHEIWSDGHWITLREFLEPGESSPVKDSSEESEEDGGLVDKSQSPHPLPPPVWMMSGYLTIFLLLIFGMLGWTQTWVAPEGSSSWIGLGLGLIGGFFGLLTLFQGEKKHGILIVVFSVILAFGNMMLT